MTLTIPLVLFVLAGMLLLALTGCVPPPPPPAPVYHEAGYAPAYPAYEVPPPGRTTLRQGMMAVCE
jgi:hypothetical protein